jgi:hypothetical protein
MRVLAIADTTVSVALLCRSTVGSGVARRHVVTARQHLAHCYQRMCDRALVVIACARQMRLAAASALLTLLRTDVPRARALLLRTTLPRDANAPHIGTSDELLGAIHDGLSSLSEIAANQIAASQIWSTYFAMTQVRFVTT